MSRKEKEVIPVEVTLTDEEKLKYGRELAETRNRARDAECRKKSYIASIKSDIESCEMRDAELSRKINTGKEFRDMECIIMRDWEAGTRKWVRPDTGEVVREDIIPEHERQEELRLKEESEAEAEEQEAKEEKPAKKKGKKE